MRHGIKYYRDHLLHDLKMRNIRALEAFAPGISSRSLSAQLSWAGSFNRPMLELRIVGRYRAHHSRMTRPVAMWAVRCLNKGYAQLGGATHALDPVSRGLRLPPTIGGA